MLFKSLFSLLVLGFGILQVINAQTEMLPEATGMPKIPQEAHPATQLPEESQTPAEVNIPTEEDKIVGGHVTTIATIPYQVYLRKFGSFICGGALVAPRFVVSAGHCVKGAKPKQFTVHGGSTHLTDGNGETRDVDLFIIPSVFNLTVLHMDVSVLKLSSQMTGKNIRPIALCGKFPRMGALVKVSGWGLKSESGSVSNPVRAVRVPVISKAKCKADYAGIQKLTRSMFCAAVPGKKDSCSGDSGGPLVFKGRLCGIVSWGIGCAEVGFPGVYTNVRVVAKFIRTAIRKHS